MPEHYDTLLPSQTGVDFSSLLNTNAGGASSPTSLLSRISGGGLISDPSNMSFSESLFGGTTAEGGKIGGFGMPLLGLGKSLLGGYQGFKQAKTAQDALEFQKGAFSKQFEAQRSLINNQLRDQDAARRRRDPGYQSTTKFLT